MIREEFANIRAPSRDGVSGGYTATSTRMGPAGVIYDASRKYIDGDPAVVRVGKGVGRVVA